LLQQTIKQWPRPSWRTRVWLPKRAQIK
jgi:hypothetical protein